MMNHFRLCICLICVVLLALLLTGCVQSVSPTPAPSPAATPASLPASTSLPAATFPLTLTDDLGREVTIEDRPERIVSLLPSNTEVLFAVGAGGQVVGVTSYCNYPEEATAREQVGGITNQSLSVETIVALEPDLVLASGSQDEIIQVLQDTGLAVIVLEPATFDDIYANIELVGQVTGHFDQATALTTDLRNRVAAIGAKVGTIPADQRVTVFYEVWHDPLMTAGPHTFIGQLVELAGGKSIFHDVAEDWPQVSAEVIIERNPEVIIGPDNHSDELTIDNITSRAGWDNINAVTNKRIYIYNGDAISRPGPRIVDILEEVARDLYPGLF
ncbi:MAG: cobalamin-binding protein [Anaerolineae bacterium]|nr:cobalamin-binding protein [Anaerolineae bacterium]